MVTVDIDDGLQALQNDIDVACVFLHHNNAVVLFVGGQRDAVAVKDQTARGRQQTHIDSVFFGQQAELIGLFNLHRLHSPAQQTRHAQLR